MKNLAQRASPAIGDTEPEPCYLQPCDGPRRGNDEIITSPLSWTGKNHKTDFADLVGERKGEASRSRHH